MWVLTSRPEFQKKHLVQSHNFLLGIVAAALLTGHPMSFTCHSWRFETRRVESKIELLTFFCFQIGFFILSGDFRRIARLSDVVTRRRHSVGVDVNVGVGVGEDGQQPQQQRRQLQSGGRQRGVDHVGRRKFSGDGRRRSGRRLRQRRQRRQRRRRPATERVRSKAEDSGKEIDPKFRLKKWSIQFYFGNFFLPWLLPFSTSDANQLRM